MYPASPVVATRFRTALRTRLRLLVVPFLVTVLPTLRVFAQSPGRTVVIGFLGPASAAAYARWLDVLNVTLRESGYVEGRNLRTEYRYGEGNYERLPSHAADLVRLKVDVIVTSSTPATLAVKKATASIPIVTALISDPDETGVVASLRQPGGNVTGPAFFLRELNEKRLELLRETLPKIKRVAFFVNPSNITMTRLTEQANEQARLLGLELITVPVRDAADVEPRFSEINARRPDAAIFVDDPVFNAVVSRIGELSLRYRLPTIGFDERVAEGGALLAYSVDQADLFRQAAAYVVKILRGARPADLPIERSSRFLLTVNRKTAQTLNISIPTPVLLRADRIIQ